MKTHRGHARVSDSQQMKEGPNGDCSIFTNQRLAQRSELPHLSFRNPLRTINPRHLLCSTVTAATSVACRSAANLHAKHDAQQRRSDAH
jgi:hypothetical protein